MPYIPWIVIKYRCSPGKSADHAQFPQCWTLLVVFTFDSSKRIFSPLYTLLSTLGFYFWFIEENFLSIIHIALYFRTSLLLTKGLPKGSMSTKQKHSISYKNDFILRQVSTCFITVIYAVTRNLHKLFRFIFLLTLKWHITVLN